MKKILPLIAVLCVVLVLVWYYAATRPGATTGETSQPGSMADRTITQDAPANEDAGVAADGMTGEMEGVDGEDGEGEEAVPDKPAAQVYTSAEEALKAVKQAAANYDDIILEQFTKPGPDCSWCESFYKSLREAVMVPDTSDDEKSYYSELLAISGRPENVSMLVDSIRSLGDNEKSDIFAEALELTVGGEDVVNFLGDQLSSTTDNDLLKESLIAALTNQGGRKAAELLYKQTSLAGDAEGYYPLGIGLGEFVPDDEAMPFLQDLVRRRDQYSHLAVKALLNNGVDGLKLVFDELSSGKNADFDKSMLKDAQDHVNYDEESENFLKDLIANSKNQLVSDTAKQFLDSFSQGEEEAGIE